MIGAVKRPSDYSTFIEKHDYEKQGLVASVTCTIQVYDECEEMLGNPELGKLYIATRCIRFSSQLSGVQREREFPWSQIRDITSQRKLQPAKVPLVLITFLLALSTSNIEQIEVACVGLRYSLFNFRSVYEFDQTLAHISRLKEAVQLSPTVLVVGANSLISMLIVKVYLSSCFLVTLLFSSACFHQELLVKSNVRVLFSNIEMNPEIASIPTSADRMRSLGFIFASCQKYR